MAITLSWQIVHIIGAVRTKSTQILGGKPSQTSVLFPNKISSVPFLSCVQPCDPWTAARQTSLSITNSRSWLKLTSMESMMPSNHLILSPSLPAFNLSQHQGFFLISQFFIRWPKCWSFCFSISPSNDIQDLFPLGLTGLISLQSKGLSRVLSNTTVKNHQFLY